MKEGKKQSLYKMGAWRMHREVVGHDFEASYARSCVARMLSCAASVDSKGLVSKDEVAAMRYLLMSGRLIVS